MNVNLFPVRLRLIIAALLALFVQTAWAGSGTAKLTCRSASGRTLFVAYLQDIRSTFEGAELSIEGHVLSFPAETTPDESGIVWDPENSVFTLTFLHSTSDGPIWFNFWAIPSTFKVISGDRGSSSGARYEFEGIIEAKEPRPDKALITPKIRMTCTLEYKI